VGIDLAGDEINFPPDMFKRFFKRIHSDGLYRSTVHAGEVTDHEQIWTAIKELNADRIGHGTVSIRDEKLQDYLKEKQIALEQCITSNYQTGAWEDERNHPLGELYRRGVPVTVNSDDPFIQDTDLTDDYIKAVKYFDFNIDDLVNLNLTALRSAFLDKRQKKRIIDRYIGRVEAFKKSLFDD
jgi:adenosine deaminase